MIDTTPLGEALNFDKRETVLSVRGVTKFFQKAKAVDGLDLCVKKKEIIGFLGPNGAGKTTSLRMMLGLIHPDKGEVSLFGKTPGDAIFGRIGFLPEERGLYRKITCRNAIAYIAGLNGLRRRQALERADELLEAYGLGEERNHKIKTLSKGMAQKVQLLAAIAHDPEFLVLDEPFSGLDPVNQTLLEGMIRDIAGRGRTIIFSTHVMEHAERLCERIVLMSKGVKIFDGALADALAVVPINVRVHTSSPIEKLQDILSDVVGDIRMLSFGQYNLELRHGKLVQSILEICVSNDISITHFEPHKPRLHDAFVVLVERAQKAIHTSNL